MIEKRGDKWVLLSSDGSKVLGEHDTKEKAEEQERAIQASKTKRDARIDVVRLGEPRKTANGFLEAPAYLSRVGVLDYRNPDGSTRRELRLPEEVFRADSLETLRHAPVVTMDNHRIDTDHWITSENARYNMVGFVSGTPHREENFVGGTVVITDKRHIDATENKELGDLSCGYHCDTEDKAGEWNGQQYDVIQRNIKYNHVALVPRGKGRAGEQVALHLDTIEPTFEGINKMPEPKKEEGQATEKMAEALLQKDKEIAEMKKRFDAMDGEIKALKEEVKKAKDPDEIKRRVDAEIEVNEAVKKVCGEDADLKDSVRDRKERVIKKVYENMHLDSKMSDDQIDGMYRVAVENSKDTDLRKSRDHLDAIGNPSSPQLSSVKLAYLAMNAYHDNPRG